MASRNHPPRSFYTRRFLSLCRRAGWTVVVLGLWVGTTGRADEGATTNVAPLSVQSTNRLLLETHFTDTSPAPAESGQTRDQHAPVLMRQASGAEQSDGSFTRSNKSGSTPSITVSDEPLEHLLRNKGIGLPDVRLTLRAGPELENPELRRLELGLPGEFWWLVHEGAEGEDSTTGIELRRDW